MRALLDTCTLIWLVSDSAQISAKAARAIDAANDLYLSDASIWELGLKWNAGKIGLPAPPRAWVPARYARWSISAVVITPDQAIHRYPVAALW